MSGVPESLPGLQKSEKVDAAERISAGPAFLLEPGDLLLLVTDGIAEATARDERMFQIDRALDVVLAHRDCTAQQIVEALAKFGGIRIEDDRRVRVGIRGA